VRRSFVAGLAALVAVAGALVVMLLWLPAVREHRDQAWQTAGREAMARVALPAPFRPHDDVAAGLRNLMCRTAAGERCYLVGGVPVDHVDAVRAALAPLATRPVRQSCRHEALPEVPDNCLLFVPVKGSELMVWLFARPTGGFRSTAQGGHTIITHGTYVQLLVKAR
jgi:hypothetical protein